MREDACVRTCQPDYIWSEKLKDWSIADVGKLNLMDCWRTTQGTNTNNFSCYFLKDNDSVDNTLKLFFELESLGIKDDPCYRKDDQAMNIFKETVQYNNNRYVVELPFVNIGNELSNNISVAKQRFQSLWGRLRRDKTLYTQYKETIQDYLNQGIIEKVNDTEINVHKPMYYLPHQAIKKEGRVTTSTRIVFDAASHQANELSLNDCLWPDLI
ncbi:DUF1758 domain-containing protein [Trichonephila clavipes]|nr:DUF1758 domain-containing protein [Trichonephila clavipes]